MFFQKKEVTLKILRGEAIRGWRLPAIGKTGRLRKARRQRRCPEFDKDLRPTGCERLFYCLNRRHLSLRFRQWGRPQRAGWG